MCFRCAASTAVRFVTTTLTFILRCYSEVASAVVACQERLRRTLDASQLGARAQLMVDMPIVRDLRVLEPGPVRFFLFTRPLSLE